MRRETFHVPLKGSSPAYAPVAGFESVVKAIVECKFAVAFLEPPLMKATIAWKWKDTDGTAGYDGSTEFEPVITACVMNWKRVKGAWCFVGADTSIRVYDHPFQADMIATLVFSGPALMTPFKSVDETEDSTTKVEV